MTKLTSAQMEYSPVTVKRRRSFLRRLRRTIRANTLRSAVIVFVSFVMISAGIAAFHYFVWLHEAAEESANRIIDEEYRSVGIEPTRDARERAELEAKVRKYEERMARPREE